MKRPKGNTRTVEYTVQEVLNEYKKTGNYFRDTGYAITGPLFLGYTLWLIQRAHRKGVRDLYFLSRDGWNVYKLFNLISEKLHLKVPHTRYFYGSRRAMVLPTAEYILTDGNSEIRQLISSWWEGVPLREFYTRLGIELSEGEFRSIARKAGFASVNYNVKGRDRQKLIKFLVGGAKYIIKKGKQEKTLLIDYIKQEGMADSAYPAMVDIGWGGTMQKSLYRLLNIINSKKHNKLDGFYLGTNSRIQGVEDLGMEAEGFLMTTYPQPMSQYIIWQSSEILEFMFSAPHATTLYFSRNKAGDVVPVLSRINNTEEYRTSARNLQGAAFRFVADFLEKVDLQTLKEFLLSSDTDIDPDFFFLPFIRVALLPNSNEVKHLGTLKHIPGLGETAIGDTIIVKTPGYSPFWLAYRFEHAYWENGFLKTLNKVQKFILWLSCTKYRNRRKLRIQTVKFIGKEKLLP